MQCRCCLVVMDLILNIIQIIVNNLIKNINGRRMVLDQLRYARLAFISIIRTLDTPSMVNYHPDIPALNMSSDTHDV